MLEFPRRNAAVRSKIRLRHDLRGHPTYQPPRRSVDVRLSTNESPSRPPALLRARLADYMRELPLNIYPDPGVLRLREALAARVQQDTPGVWKAGSTGDPIEHVWVGNGSMELLAQLFAAFGGPGRRVLLLPPTYEAYESLVRASGAAVLAAEVHRPVGTTVATLVAAAAADITVWCSPNNPTGDASELAVIDAICEASSGLVIVDEAYVDFSTSPSAAALLGRHTNLVVTRTFSKIGFAAARCGWLLADPEVVSGVRSVCPYYHLSAFAQAVGRLALEHSVELAAHVERIRKERARLAGHLEDLLGVGAVLASEANFLCFRTPLPANRVWNRLLDHGVQIRNVSSYATLDNCLRVTVGTPQMDDVFLTALGAILDEEAAA